MCIAAATAAFVANVATPAPARACGGFFCSATPVDQNAERIVFRVNRGGTVTAIIQIVYSGAPEDFAWILPMPSVAELETFPQLALTALDLATQPVYQPPWQCFPVAAAEDGAGGTPNGGGEVTVHQRAAVGPFDTVTVSSDDPRALVTWLRAEGYRITTAMEPFVDLYVDEGFFFLAMKLEPGRDTAEVAPISVTYQSTVPFIPLRLSAVAAEPEMGVIAWVLGDGRFGPANFADVTVPDDLIRFDPFAFRTNYLDVVSRRVDEAGGHGFVTEYAGSTGPLAQRFRDTFVPPDNADAVAANAKVVELMESASYLTRLYTRISPEEMGLDPSFRPVDTVDVSNMHDLSDRPDACDPRVTPPPCDLRYCGAAGECFETDAVEGAVTRAGCACVDGAVARVVSGGPGGAATTCQDGRVRFPDAAAEDGGGAGVVFGDPCQTVTCGGAGRGACLDLNGTATCQCERGRVAVPIRAGERFVPSCVVPKVEIPAVFYERPIADLPNLPAFRNLPGGGGDGGGDDDEPPARTGSGFCAASGAAPAWLAFVAIGVAGLRRARRRSGQAR
jgi:hypothetical protein